MRYIPTFTLCASLVAFTPFAAAQCDGPAVPSIGSPATPGTATPATPTPATPSTPSPATPNTPGPKTPGPVTPGRAGPATPRGGMSVSFTRQSTALEILQLNWDFPLPKQPKEDATKGTTRAAVVVKALPAVDAFAQIAGDNPRPLLVLRECTACAGTEHAFLSRRFNNEKTKLLAQWFHCVKLPPNVLAPNHPFRNVFEATAPSHLFLSLADGSDRIAFDGMQQQSELQAAMIGLIEKAYEKKPQPAIKQMLTFLSQFDHFDTREQELRDRLQKERLEKGPKHAKVLKLKAELEDVQKKRDLAMKSAKAVCDLKLKVVAKN